MVLDKEIYNIFLCGVGGQGILTASEIAGWAAIFDGYQVKKSEVHGMAQRGGSVESHFRFGKTVYSPIIPEGRIDIFVPFHKEEHERLKKRMTSGCIDLLDGLLLCEKIVENKKMVNSFMLGYLSRFIPVSEESWIKGIKKVFHKLIDENISVFLKARNLDL